MTDTAQRDSDDDELVIVEHSDISKKSDEHIEERKKDHWHLIQRYMNTLLTRITSDCITIGFYCVAASNKQSIYWNYKYQNAHHQCKDTLYDLSTF